VYGRTGGPAVLGCAGNGGGAVGLSAFVMLSVSVRVAVEPDVPVVSDATVSPKNCPRIGSIPAFAYGRTAARAVAAWAAPIELPVTSTVQARMIRFGIPREYATAPPRNRPFCEPRVGAGDVRGTRRWYRVFRTFRGTYPCESLVRALREPCETLSESLAFVLRARAADRARDARARPRTAADGVRGKPPAGYPPNYRYHRQKTPWRMTCFDYLRDAQAFEIDCENEYVRCVRTELARAHSGNGLAVDGRTIGERLFRRVIRL
jgi:hypothetical protein